MRDFQVAILFISKSDRQMRIRKFEYQVSLWIINDNLDVSMCLIRAALLRYRVSSFHEIFLSILLLYKCRREEIIRRICNSKRGIQAYLVKRNKKRKKSV